MTTQSCEWCGSPRVTCHICNTCEDDCNNPDSHRPRRTGQVELLDWPDGRFVVQDGKTQEEPAGAG